MRRLEWIHLHLHESLLLSMHSEHWDKLAFGSGLDRVDGAGAVRVAGRGESEDGVFHQDGRPNVRLNSSQNRKTDCLSHLTDLLAEAELRPPRRFRARLTTSYSTLPTMKQRRPGSSPKSKTLPRVLSRPPQHPAPQPLGRPQLRRRRPRRPLPVLHSQLSLQVSKLT